ncbi:hypothetical protein [Flavobacterium subsaxonicum]|uniref:Receptor L-domain domain-containing protein n=1 Tax=Flavobacterium subsaxonicum WB 4.1-42 = DSM 21790 TaxID=1121898 RepID=A0A0A2MJ48_9FLAO|nr:hypothetical protein [Flavobacterium subsaxonicum]KGO91601.1 hypothetical protein Q766_17190 [Flavobacterium subsaxonicum WB 4.1-42 = DSM 21790]
MKKFVFLIMAVFSIAACSNDDNNAVDTEPVAIEPVVSAECTFNGDVTLTSQQEIDAFAAHNYCQINGTVTVKQIDNVSQNVNLKGLEGLVIINGDFIIQDNPTLINLNGLTNLKRVKGSFRLLNNPMLFYIDGVGNLESVGNVVNISGNEMLQDMKGLEKLTSLKFVSIHNNAALQSMQGLDNLVSIDGLSIENNMHLASLNGLNALTSIGSDSQYGELTISGNAALQSLNGLQNLTSFKGMTFKLSGNTILKNFCSLQGIAATGNITTIFEAFGNYYNPTVSNINSGNCSVE